MAQTSVRHVSDMPIPIEAEVESLHASPAAFLQPQSSSLRDHQHPAGRDRAHLFDSERFKRNFVTTLAELAFRIVGDALIRQLTDCHLLPWPSEGADPTQIMQRACSAGPAVLGPPILMADGSSSDAGSCRVANGTIRFRVGPAPNTASENIQAAPSKPRRGANAAHR